ncbi:MAG: NAD(P)/FAD-dependent oxidoreductase [Deltaproteobacteria bacterium]|nr:MAG: NAD(P)/FAD-dependent oxidoreductase [Deltaproteobacteria bacterium]
MSEKLNMNKTYNVLPGIKMGVLSTEYLEKVTEIAKKHNIPFFKITSAQRLAIVGHTQETAEQIWQELGEKTGPQKPVGIHYIQACPGIKWCKYGRQDSLELGEKIEKAFGDLPLPAKTKVGISGCPLNCCESYVRDIGVFGKKNGWTLVFGGNGGGCPRIADIVAEDLSDEEVIELLGKCLEFYRDNARKMERTGRFMRRTDIEEFWKKIGVRGKTRY